MTMAQISITVSETARWHALIGRAEYFAHELLPHNIEDYLVRLFMRFNQQETPLAAEFSRAKQLTAIDDKLQNLGDQCLLLCGFYPEAAVEYGVSLDEFASMGREAFQKLATSRDNENSIIFEFLANNFVQVSELLCYINDYTECSKGDPINIENQDLESLTIIFNRSENHPFRSFMTHRVLN